jgi:hypothetical protein
LSRLPKELGREERFCERCGERTEHILYRVPKKVVLIYIKDHPESLHATCVSCAKSTILTGDERERVLVSLRDPGPAPGSDAGPGSGATAGR